MEITYQGDASFLLTGDRSVAINPASASATDIVLQSWRHQGAKQIVNGPGEYEIGGALIVTIQPNKQSPGLVHAINLDGLNVLHVNGSPCVLTEDDLTAIGKVDALIMTSDDVKAAEALAVDLSPRVLIPFGANAEQLCAMFGVREAPSQPRFAWNGSGVPPRAVLLKAQTTRKRPARAA
jgi:hypothetical protein